MESRIRSFEDIVSQLQFQQDSCRPYMKLAKDSQSLIKLQQTLNTLKKQNNELEHEFQNNQEALEEIQMKAEYAQKFSQDWIQTEHDRREETLSRIDQKLAQLEDIFKNIGQESTITVQDIGEKLKAEIQSLTIESMEKFKRHKEVIRETLETASEYKYKELSDIQKSQNDAEEKLNHFEMKYAGVIKNYGAKGEHAQGTDELKSMMIEEIKNKIQQAVNECKQTFDHKFKHFKKKFNEEIKRIQDQLEDIKQ